MDAQLTIAELWPLADEEAAQRIAVFLRELQTERKTAGTSQLEVSDMIYLVRDTIWSASIATMQHGGIAGATAFDAPQRKTVIVDGETKQA